jgi:dolichol kinase
MTGLRKLIHAAALLVPIMVELTSRNAVLVLLCVIVTVYSVAEVLRLKGRRVAGITSFTLRMSRPEETERFIVTPVYLAVGVILGLLLFPTNIAYASIGCVAVGDPVAAYVGDIFGRMRLRPHKTFEGSISGLLACFLVASIVVQPAVAFAGAVGAMVMELLDVPNDNLTMPIAAGGMMLLVTLASR